jgi:DNA-binding transcriptional LysR family regulator
MAAHRDQERIGASTITIGERSGSRLTVDIGQLEAFVAVAEELHFARAAERLQVVPSAVSQQISRLERELGGRLFDRTSRTVRLTPAGQVLLEEATAVLSAVSRAEAETRLAIRAMATTLRVGYASSGHGSLIVPAIMAFENKFPDLRVDLHELSSPEVVAAVGRGELDAGFAWQSEGPNILRSLAVAHRPLAVLMPSDHRLAGSPKVAVSDICTEPFVLERRDNNPTLYDEIVAALHGEGVAPRIRRHVGGVATMTAVVNTGDGLGLAVDDGLDAEIGRGLVAVPIDMPPATLRLFWCATSQSRPLAMLVSHLKDFVLNV